MGSIDDKDKLIASLKLKLDLYREVAPYAIQATKLAIENIEQGIPKEKMESNKRVLRFNANALKEALIFVERDLGLK